MILRGGGEFQGFGMAEVYIEPAFKAEKKGGRHEEKDNDHRDHLDHDNFAGGSP